MLATLSAFAHAVVACDAAPVGRTKRVSLGALSKLGIGVVALLADGLAHGSLGVEAGLLGVPPLVLIAAILPN